jgi:hypothetical protein
MEKECNRKKCILEDVIRIRGTKFYVKDGKVVTEFSEDVKRKGTIDMAMLGDSCRVDFVFGQALEGCSSCVFGKHCTPIGQGILSDLQPYL